MVPIQEQKNISSRARVGEGWTSLEHLKKRLYRTANHCSASNSILTTRVLRCHPLSVINCNNTTTITRQHNKHTHACAQTKKKKCRSIAAGDSNPVWHTVTFTQIGWLLFSVTLGLFSETRSNSWKRNSNWRRQTKKYRSWVVVVVVYDTITRPVCRHAHMQRKSMERRGRRSIPAVTVDFHSVPVAQTSPLLVTCQWPLSGSGDSALITALSGFLGTLRDDEFERWPRRPEVRDGRARRRIFNNDALLPHHFGD